MCRSGIDRHTHESEDAILQTFCGVLKGLVESAQPVFA
jgi:hypothetical protein